MIEHLLYCPIIEPMIYLDKKQSHYCSNVLRLKVGSIVHLTDGLGYYFTAKISVIRSKQVQLKIINKLTLKAKNQHFIHLAIAPPKSSERLSWLVEKTVELGIHQITFLNTQFGERPQIDLERLYRKAIAAMQQALRPNLPILITLTPFFTFLNTLKLHDQYFIALFKKEYPSVPLLKIAVSQKSYCILIGAEGGFSEDEIQAAQIKKFNPISLSNNRLRIETAAVAACSALHLINTKF